MSEDFLLYKKIGSRMSPSLDENKVSLKVAAFSLTAAGTTELIAVAANDVVLDLWLDVDTAPNQNVEIGDASDVDRFVAAGTVDARYAGVAYRYAAADTIDIKAAASTTEGDGHVIALIWHDA